MAKKKRETRKKTRENGAMDKQAEDGKTELKIQVLTLLMVVSTIRMFL